jgi:hypothetical protein
VISRGEFRIQINLDHSTFDGWRGCSVLAKILKEIALDENLGLYGNPNEHILRGFNDEVIGFVEVEEC